MSRHHRSRFGTPVLATLALLFNLTPVASSLASAETYTVPAKMQQPLDVSFTTPTKDPQEIVSARTANSKRFLNPDGTLTTRLYSQPVHYRNDQTGAWEPIDSTLTAGTDGKLHNKANHFSVDLQSAANGGFFNLTEQGNSLSFRPVFAGGAKGTATKNKLHYPDVATDTDLDYAVLATGLKESLILKSTKAPTTFSFELKTGDLTYQKADDGSILFFKKGDTTPVFQFAKPFLEDAKHATSDKVTYDIQTDDAGKTMLDVTTDAAWLQDPARAYPVVLDPTAWVEDPNQIKDTFVESLCPTCNRSNFSDYIVGQSVNHGTTRALYAFPQLPDIESGAVITSAILHVVNDQVDLPSQSPVVELHPINAPWTDTQITWNDEQKLSIGGVDSTYQVTNTVPDWWSIPVTKLVQDWYNGVQPNYGLELRYQDESQASRELYGATTDDPGRLASS